MQVHDNEMFPITVNAVDTKGFPVTDTSAVSFSVDNADNGRIADGAEVGQNAGEIWFVAGNPGSCVLSGTDGNISGTLAIDVTAGDVASLNIQAGTAQPQPPAAP